MPPNEIEQLKNEVKELRNILGEIVRSDRYVFKRDIALGDNTAIRCNGVRGVNIGKEETDKIGFYGVTPVDRPATIATVTETGSHTDGDARNRINSIISRLQELGLIK